MIQVHVRAFGILKDTLGSEPAPLALPAAATITDLLNHIAAIHPAAPLKGIAVSVNAEYATSTHPLHDGDEVGLLPPVSGGAPGTTTYLTRDPIDAPALVSAAKHPEDGALVVFDGIVRNHSRGRQTLHLDYEAYEQMAAKQIAALAAEARTKFGVRHVTLVHRLGRLAVGETSVLIVVASAHRAQAYEASRWLIDTLKQTVPIWKKETFTDGAVWADGEPFPSSVAVTPESADAS
jgi:molybdopterin synthase catalytic subunit